MLGTGSCESCRPDSRPARTERERRGERDDCSLQLDSSKLETCCYYLVIILLGGHSPGERWCYYRVVNDLLPLQLQCSLIPEDKHSIPPTAAKITLDWITCCIIAARHLAQHLMAEARQNHNYQGRLNTGQEGTCWVFCFFLIMENWDVMQRRKGPLIIA